MNGGGIYANYNSTIISNCIISGNAARGCTAQGSGGAGAATGTYQDCQIINNFAETYGGGTGMGLFYNCLVAENRAGTIGGGSYRGTFYDCVISNNIARDGGGIAGHNVASTPAWAYDTLIVGNQAASNGGGAYRAQMTDCRFESNEARYGGGSSDSIANGCTFTGNIATIDYGGGGGMNGGSATNCIFAYNRGRNSAGGATISRAVNCLFYGNSGYGGGLYLQNNGLYENCTIVGNQHSGAVIEGAKTATVVNAIIYYNDPARANLVQSPPKALVVLKNSSTTPLSDVWDDTNTSSEPMLIDPGTGIGTNHVAGVYRLKGSSPCINKGQILEWMDGALDLDGNPRIDKLTGKPDMGCYELVYSGSAILVR